MNYTSPLPVDKNGNPVPVFVPDTRKTINIAIADATTCATSSQFSGTTPVKASFTTSNIFSGTNTMTFTSKLDGWPSESINITFAVGSALGVTISGYDITINHFNQEPKCADIEGMFAANPAIDRLVSVSYTNGEAAVKTSAAIAKTYLSGYDDGETPVVVRVLPTANGFIGISTGALTIGSVLMPVLANVIEYIALLPGEVITGVGAAAVAGAKIYLTPGRKY